jgi:small basic protein
MGRILRESPVEYFKEMIEAALAHQRVQTDELTACYLVNLLAGFAVGEGQPDDGPHGPLGLALIAALERAGAARAAQLRKVGDRSLFISGFFSDSLKRQLADVDYYVSLGAYAYHSLSHEEDEVLGPVFAELGRKFVSFVDVLEEVSERSALMSNHDLLRLYEKWLRTGSRRGGNLLVERGIVPNKSIDDKFVQ